MTPTPRKFSHIGLSVPDLDKTVEFYRDIPESYVIMEPTEMLEDDSDIVFELFSPSYKSTYSNGAYS